MDQGAAPPARRRRAVPKPLHAARRFALVVRRALPAQGAGDPRGVPRRSRAFDALIERDRPLAVRSSRDRIRRRAAGAPARGVPLSDAGPRSPAPEPGLARMDARATALAAGGAAVAAASAAAGQPAPRRASRRSSIAPSGGRTATTAAPSRTSARCCARSRRGSAPSRHPLRRRRPAHELPRAPLVGSAASAARRRPPMVPIERFAPRAALRSRATIWRERHAMRGAAVEQRRAPRARRRSAAATAGRSSASSSRASRCCSFRGRRGRWTKRRAALDAHRARGRGHLRRGRRLGPRARARVPSARHPLAGLQHGFIYRHWLNYRHEPDEMLPDPDNPADAGFPRPALTLLFDEYAARHLATAGRFPPTRSPSPAAPRLDELIAPSRALTPADIDRDARGRRGAGDAGARRCSPPRSGKRAPCPAGARRGGRAAMPDVQLAIKPHPAETPDVYAAVVAAAPNVRVLAGRRAAAAAARAPRAPSSRSTRPSRSTRSRWACPSLVIGLPNNLTPFVDAGDARRGRRRTEIRAGAAPDSCMIRSSASSTGSRRGLARRHRLRSGRRRAARSADAVIAHPGALALATSTRS